ncbi:pentatricopeptide repeat-containing protein At5g52850, chloroplastic [Herrania umbratica]|uniref:Pentatricopeptide repeat-containing protein At5g52850, chloroplastic n=1 Tax=Herrania umbratica TaxID=108875 RepID=A0A6J1AXB3_9ROSI|nr:pentatricopeptide repeat-containing protein At5g52850, chloroplastic [Herrania umbratica]
MLCKTGSRIIKGNEGTRLEETCSRVLPFCNSNSLKEGISVHCPIIKLGLQDRLYLNNNLLSLYAKCFGVDKARHFFDEMPYKDVVSWTGILSAYVQRGNHDCALEFFDSMLISGQRPNEFTLSSVLRSCSALGEFEYGTCIQAYMIKQGFDQNPILVSGLLDFYSKFNFIGEAYKLFIYVGNHDTVSWTMMISSFVQAQRWSKALQLYVDMIEAGVPPNEFTFVKLLGACSVLGLKYGKLVHAHMLLRGLKLNVVLKTALVDMYARFQRMEDAIKVSNLTSEYDTLLCTAVISGFAQNFMFRKAIAAFREMRISGILPNNFTFSSLLSVSSLMLSLELGEQIHSRVVVAGLEDDVNVGNALVTMYVKCSDKIKDALRVFRGISLPNVISWTSLIAGFGEHGFQQDALHFFVEMRVSGVQPNSFTISSIIGSFNAAKLLPQTLMLHGHVIKTNLYKDIVVQNALIDVYAGLGMLDYAWQVVHMMSHRDAITYTSLASRVNQLGHHELALHIITDMYNDDIKIDAFSMASFLSASADLGTLVTGKQLHSHSVKSGLGRWVSVANGLVDLYGKCGCICDAQRAFGEITVPDIFSWNGLISGLASIGSISSALSAFDDMRLAGVRPDSVTFLLLLSACNNGKLVDLGLEYFQSMREVYDIVPQLDHYVYLVDILGRGGRLEEAMEVIQTMPFRADASICKTLLRACKAHRNIPLAEDMARRGLELDPSDPAFYILLANLYDDSGRHDFGEKTRKLMREKQLRKNPSQSWVQIRSKVHLFVAGERSHPQINEIYEKIESIDAEIKNHRYLYQGMGIGDSYYHSEKLAVAFGLLNTPSKIPIHIIKNNSICRNCHDFITFVTDLVDKEIIVREGNRLHSFRKGQCSCRGCQF